MLEFLGIGAQKAGTTWLYEMLIRHPWIRFPGRKELHFWNRHRNQGLEWYRAQLGEPVNGVRRGEITPAYAILPRDRVEEIRAVAPNLRLMYIMRNPIDRAWSAALMAVERAEMQPSEASDRWFIDHFQSEGSRARGDYESTIRRWRGVFANPQLLLMRYERISREPEALLKQCADHLEVDPAPFRVLPAQLLRRRVFAGPREPIRPSLRDVLRELYADRIISLSSYLGEDLSDWLDES